MGWQRTVIRGRTRWTWSGMRCGGACELAKDRRTGKGEVGQANSEQCQVDQANSGQCQVDLVRFRGVDLVRPSWL